jgi:antirestriction protein ArdC
MPNAPVRSRLARESGSARHNTWFGIMTFMPIRHKTHWSGHKSRLDRNLTNRFANRAYAAEELVAELASAFLCAEFGINKEVRHASYIANWIELLRADDRAFFTAGLASGVF